MTGKRRIKLKPQSYFMERGVNIPSFIWREPPFIFNPVSFALSDERLQSKIYDESYQWKSLETFEDDPSRDCVYAVASEPNDAKALYFAVYLIQLFLEQPSTEFRKIRWERVYQDFKNDLLNGEHNLSMLVLSNLTPNSTAVKLEKTRDLLDAYAGIPRVVVISGEDPITFFSRKLYYKVNHIFFHSSKLVRRKVEVVGILFGIYQFLHLALSSVAPVIG